ncbi:prepilin-type N-terminal cleavage/methylation domain-containing protein [Acinetobacter pittii]|uniref:prepilin-type N-terminal cleavage/methylation domain-containing protein n=1 Tax=Acinetobacter pittii TaxID=48296 RepID=UPI0008399CA3|nr:prepilin-type N-terminal cleavage/methylation domain-containing protein [Acinetobacter pittii]OCY34596.1 prepilin-type N-terminal cleavage/methylation domain-containing protein [Acinetobacter pittii]
MKNIQIGFTFIELIVSLALLALLASVVIPISDLASRHSKERELKKALIEIRDAIDEYKVASDKNEIPIKYRTSSGYPPNLSVLEGIPGERGGKKTYRFLRKIPADPFAVDKNIPPEQTWGIREFLSEADNPKKGDDVYDIYSLSTQVGSNGMMYREW